MDNSQIKKTFFVSVLLVGLLFILTTITPNTQFDNNYADSTVMLADDRGHGSAVHIGNGYYITAAHVIGKGDKELYITTDDERTSETPVEVLWTNSTYDIALVKSDIENVKSSNIDCRIGKVGEELTLKGSPLSIRFATTWGRVSSNSFTDYDAAWKEMMIVDASLAPGMSGGGAFDADNELVGINVGLPLWPLSMTDGTMAPFAFVVPGKTICKLLGR